MNPLGQVTPFTAWARDREEYAEVLATNSRANAVRIVRSMYGRNLTSDDITAIRGDWEAIG